MSVSACAGVWTMLRKWERCLLGKLSFMIFAMTAIEGEDCWPTSVQVSSLYKRATFNVSQSSWNVDTPLRDWKLSQ